MRMLPLLLLLLFSPLVFSLQTQNCSRDGGDEPAPRLVGSHMLGLAAFCLRLPYKGLIEARSLIAFALSLQRHPSWLLGCCCEREAQQQEGFMFRRAAGG